MRPSFPHVDKRPAKGTARLAVLERIRPTPVSTHTPPVRGIERERKTHEVCVSFDPENITTSAGDVLVITVRSRAELPPAAFLKNPIAVCATLDKSPVPYDCNALNRSSAASLARLGSLRMPWVE